METNKNAKRTLAGLMAILTVAGTVPAASFSASADAKGAPIVVTGGETTTDSETTGEESFVKANYDIVWTWDSATTAFAKFTNKEDSSDRKFVNADVVKTVIEPTCTEGGKTVYTATVEFLGETFTDVKETNPTDATGHTYGQPAWNWTETDTGFTAKAVFTCVNGDDTVEVDADEITTAAEDASCEAPGTMTYTAKATFNNDTYTDNHTVETDEALGHSYALESWDWSNYDEDGTVKAIFKCGNCDDIQEVVVTAKVVETTPATCEEAGEANATATVTFEDTEYSDTQKVTLPATDHALVSHWVWADDLSTATLYVECTNCNKITKYIATPVPTNEVAASCGKKGSVTYTVSKVVDGITYEDNQTVETDALEHVWGDVQFAWLTDAEGNVTVTVYKACQNEGCDEKDTDENVTVTSEITKKPTAKRTGVMTYTAVSEKFGTSGTYEVVIPAVSAAYDTPTFEWSDDYKTCTATAKSTNEGDDIVETVDTVGVETIPATCTEAGTTTYTATFTSKFLGETSVSVVDIPATGHEYGAPVWVWTPSDDGYTAKVTVSCKHCNAADKEYDADVTVTEKDGKLIYTGTVTIDGEVYTASIKAIAPVSNIPVVSYEKGDNSVKLTWNKVPGASKYGIVGYVKDSWKMLDQGFATSYVLKDLKPGTNYKVAVVAMFNGEWKLDFSNAITVTPNANKVPSVSFEKGDGCVKLSWTAVEDATQYGVVGYKDGDWQLLGKGTATNYVLENLREGTNYRVAVIAMINGEWNKDFSNAITVTPNANKVPTVSFEKGDGCVKLTWNAIAGATKYGICGYQNGEWKMLDQGTATNYVLNNLREGTNYGVSVIAMVDGQWNKDFSNAITVTPNINKVPTVSFEKGDGCVKLTWTAVAGATKYGICGYQNGEWKMLDQGTATNYVLNNLREGTNYGVSVIAMVDGQWNKDFSNAITVTPNINKVPTVSFEKGDGCVKLTWTAVAGATKYGICGYKDGNWTMLDQGTGTSYVLNDLRAGTNYKVAVVAMVDGQWNKDFSNAIVVTPNADSTNAYPAVQTQVKDNKIGFKWTDVAGAEKYAIAVYQANKWVVAKQFDGSVHTWTSPQVANSTYKLAVVAKVNGKWVTAQAEQHSFKVTVK